MFIQTETTPNPATLKFLPGLVVLAEGTRNFDSKEDAVVSLAERLFEVEGVDGVFLGNDFITITKIKDREWFLMKPSILGIIMEHFTAGRPVLADDAASDNGAGQSGHASDQDDNEIVVQIKELLIRVCAQPLPWMVVISCSIVSTTALFTWRCRGLVPVVHRRR